MKTPQILFAIIWGLMVGFLISTLNIHINDWEFLFISNSIKYSNALYLSQIRWKMRKFLISTGEEVSVSNTMIEVDKTNIESGIDVFVEGAYVGCLINIDEDCVTEDDIKLLL